MVEQEMKKIGFRLKYIVLLKTMILLLFFCITIGVTSMKNWKTYFTPHLHKLNDLWFNNETGVVAGYYQSLDELLKLHLNESLAAQEAIILYRQGTDSEWCKVYSDQGNILQLSYKTKEKFLYALGRKHSLDGQWKAFLLFSKNFGKNWIKLPKPPENIEGINFAGNDVGYAWSIDQVFRTTNGAQTWALCEKIPFKLNVHGPTIATGTNNLFWYANKSNLFVILPNGLVQKEILPTNFITKVMTIDPNHNLWLLGKSEVDKKLHLLKRTDVNKFELVASLSYFLPNQLYVGTTISVITGTDLKNIPPAKNVMLRSKDGCKSWHSVSQFPEGTKVFFEDDAVIWQLGTMDRLQRLVN